MATALIQKKWHPINNPYYIGTHTSKSLKQKLKYNTTSFSFVTQPNKGGSLVNTLGSHLKKGKFLHFWLVSIIDTAIPPHLNKSHLRINEMNHAINKKILLFTYNVTIKIHTNMC